MCADKPFKTYKLNKKVIEVIQDSFTNGVTARIDSHVAQLLAIPADEPYRQIWNAELNWWELRISHEAWFLLLGELAVLGLTYQNSSAQLALKASPENRNPSAYRKLSEKAVFPWALPFDLWLEETRAFLNALGVPRSSLIDIARPHSKLSDEAAILEQTGFSKSEAHILVSAGKTTETWLYWGLTELDNHIIDHVAGSARSGTWKDVLKYLSMLLQQSGLSYREYLDIEQTHFAGRFEIEPSPPNECKTSEITLTMWDTDEFTEHLNRTHLFTRLWRRLGWSMRELDLVLSALGLELNEHTTLRDLALIKRLQALSGLPVSALMGCIDELESIPWIEHTKEGTPIQPSLFDGVFQRPALRTLSDFDSFSKTSVASNTTFTITEHADFIAASLGVTASQVPVTN